MNRHGLNEIVEFLRKPNTEVVLVCAINEVEDNSLWITEGSYYDVLAMISTALVKYACDAEVDTDGTVTAEETFKRFADITWRAYQWRVKK